MSGQTSFLFRLYLEKASLATRKKWRKIQLTPICSRSLLEISLGTNRLGHLDPTSAELLSAVSRSILSFSKGEGMTVLYVYFANNSACALTFCNLALRILPKRTLLLYDSRPRRDWEDKFPFYINKRNTNSSKSRLWSSVLSQLESDLHRSILCSPLDVLTTSVVTTEICVYLKPVPNLLKCIWHEIFFSCFL